MIAACSSLGACSQVIEKAYKKLRLDALVIQQGRLTENTKTVNKDDLLSMVRYGAEMVFSSSVRAPTCVVLCLPERRLLAVEVCHHGRPVPLQGCRAAVQAALDTDVRGHQLNHRQGPAGDGAWLIQGLGFFD